MTDLHGHCTRMTRTGTDCNSGSDVKRQKALSCVCSANMAAEPKCSKIPMAFLVALWWLLHDEVCAHQVEFEMVRGRDWYPMLHHGNEPNGNYKAVNESLMYGGGCNSNYITFNFAENLDQSMNETSCPARRLTWIGTTEIFHGGRLQGELESGEDWCPPHGRCVRIGAWPLQIFMALLVLASMQATWMSSTSWTLSSMASTLTSASSWCLSWCSSWPLTASSMALVFLVMVMKAWLKWRWKRTPRSRSHLGPRSEVEWQPQTEVGASTSTTWDVASGYGIPSSRDEC